MQNTFQTPPFSGGQCVDGSWQEPQNHVMRSSRFLLVTAASRQAASRNVSLRGDCCYN